jgi:hypothetical protein
MPRCELFRPCTDSAASSTRRAIALIAVVMILGLDSVSAQAQLAIDNTTFSSTDGAALRYPHTVASGSNALLMVGVEVHARTTVDSVVWGTGSTSCASACTPASCLCALTQVGTVTDTNKAVTVQLWKLVNPPAGAGTVVIALPSSHRMISGATSFVGVDHSTPLGTAATDSGETGTPASVKVSSMPGAIVLDAVGTTYDESLAVAGAGQTRAYLAAESASSAAAGVTGAGSTAAGAASVTMSWSLSASSWAIIGVSINPGPTPTAGPPSPTPSATPTQPPPICVGDCDGSGDVTVDEIVTLVNMALGSQTQLSACPHGIPADITDVSQIDVSVIVQAVNNALSGCAGH